MSKKTPLIIYWSSPLLLKNVYKDLVNKSVNRDTQVNITSCPAVKAGTKNLFMMCTFQDEQFKYDVNDSVVRGLNGTRDILIERKPHFEKSIIFDLGWEIYFFSEESVLMKATAPWFHKASFQANGVTIGGEYDIGKWFRPLQLDVICWNEKGTIEFKAGEPLYYIQINTDRPIILKQFNLTLELHLLASNLVFDPARRNDKLFGGLEKRYKLFENSQYRQEIIKEIKANLLPANDQNTA